MLRKLTSPKKGSRFAAATTSSDSSKNAPQELSSLTADAPSPAQRQQPPSADLFTPDSKASPGDSHGKKTKSAKPPKATVEVPTTEPQQPASLSLGLQAVSKEGDHKGEEKEADSSPRVKSPSPLLRTPRQKSVFDADDAKATSPKAKTPKKGKRDSLGLKSLVTKREKAKEEAKPINEEPKHSPKKNKKAAPEEDDDAAGAPALSPIRRKPRPASDRTSDDKSTTATIRDATSLLSRSKRLDSNRSIAIPPLQQPELHIIGEIVGGDGFGKTSDGYCCKWSVDYGNQWVHVAGDQLGQTQIDYADNSPPDEGVLTWAHPLDLHFATTVFHGWPKILLQVWRVDTHMKMNVVGYGFVHVPFTPGHHRLSVSMWRPMGTAKEELEAALIGHTPELLTDEVLFNSAWAERCRLKTIATGRVQVDLGVILRNFHTAASKMDM